MENNKVNEELDKEVDITEISLDDEEINEWIVQLAMLKATKNSIQLELDEENELTVNYEAGEEEDSEGGNLE